MRYWYYGSGDAHYYAYSNALNEFFWYRFEKNKFLEVKSCEIDQEKIVSLDCGFIPKDVRRKAFLCEFGDEWLNDLISKRRLVLSVEDTLDLAVFKLGYPIKDLYELSVIQWDHGIQRRWKVNGEMVEQNNGGVLLVESLTRPKPKELSGEYGQFYRIKGLDSGPNVCFYLFEERDGVHKVRYELNEDRTESARLVGFDIVGRPVLVEDKNVPLVVQSRRFVIEHGIEWLHERRSGNDGPLDRDGLIRLATTLNRSIWPWEIHFDGSIAIYDDLVICSWKICDKYRASRQAILGEDNNYEWAGNFQIKEI